MQIELLVGGTLGKLFIKWGGGGGGDSPKHNIL